MLRTGYTVGRLQTYLLSVGTSEWRYVMMLSVLNHVNTYCVPDLVYALCLYRLLGAPSMKKQPPDVRGHLNPGLPAGVCPMAVGMWCR